MKKKIMLITIMLLTMFISKNEVLAVTASSNMDYSSCIAFAEGFRVIPKEIGTWEYKYCYRAVCSGGVYSKGSMTAVNGFRCENGNGTPYRKITSDGCSQYSGSCNMKGEKYCSKVEFVDCNKNADGSKYNSPYNTTAAPTIRPTTKAPTTRTTTTKNNNKTTKKTTTKRTGTNPPMPTIPVERPTTATTTTERITNNTNIKKIMVNNTDIKYSDTKDTYTLKLLYDVTDVNVTVELEDETSTYEVIGNTGMPNEEHEIKIIVTAVSGDKREVTLKVNRYNNLNNDCTLANIYSEEYPIEFSPNTYSYKLSLPKNVNSIDFEVVLSDEENASYSIEGNEKLKNKSTIKIDVRAEDGTTCQYTIKIKKESNTWKYIVAIALLAGVLVVASVLLYRYLKKSKGRYKYE